MNDINKVVYLAQLKFNTENHLESAQRAQKNELQKY